MTHRLQENDNRGHDHPVADCSDKSSTQTNLIWHLQNSTTHCPASKSSMTCLPFVITKSCWDFTLLEIAEQQSTAQAGYCHHA